MRWLKYVNMKSQNERRAEGSMKVKSESMKEVGKAEFCKEEDRRVVEARAESSSAEEVDELKSRKTKRCEAA